MYNTQTINPAYAGSRGIFGVTGLYRNQWVGFEGAPTTINAGLNTPIGGSERLGVGFNAYYDKIGPANESLVTGDLSYTIFLDYDINLAFGLKVGANVLNVDYSLLDVRDAEDLLLQSNINNRISPVVGTGLYIYHEEDWYFGLSVPNILETSHYDGDAISTASEKANIYIIGGYVFELSNRIKFKPAFLTKFTSGAPAAVDISTNFLFNERFTFGLGYRWDAALSGLAGFQVNDTVFVGYSYDFGLQELGNFNSGSHEIFLRFEVGKFLRNFTGRFF